MHKKQPPCVHIVVDKGGFYYGLYHWHLTAGLVRFLGGVL
jgi:hypothetical protein